MPIEFLLAEHTDSPEPPRTPGISPTPSSPRITRTVTARVLSPSTLSRSSVYNGQSNLVVACLLKSSRVFNSNVTHIVHERSTRSYRTWASVCGGSEKRNDAVRCVCVSMKSKRNREYEELRQVQHDIWKRELTLGGCVQQMVGAQIYQRIEVVNRARLRILMDEYKARRRGR